jgi:hypothetical protein
LMGCSDAPPRGTALPAANRIFVNREEPKHIFEKAAFAIPAESAIIGVFYGVGGQGKTALCSELMRKTDASAEPSYAFVRRALLDLHGRKKSDSDILLVWIRNGFADTGVILPCFDLAFALRRFWERRAANLNNLGALLCAQGDRDGAAAFGAGSGDPREGSGRGASLDKGRPGKSAAGLGRGKPTREGLIYANSDFRDSRHQ